MAFCPKCESEYREDVSNCPTCEVALVAELDEPPDEIDDAELFDSGEELAVIARGDFGRCLEMRNALRKAQIPCAVLREEEEVSPPSNDEHRHRSVFELLVELGRVDDAAGVLQGKWYELVDKEGLGADAQISTSADGMHCPACGHELKDEENTCPDCGLAFGEA